MTAHVMKGVKSKGELGFAGLLLALGIFILAYTATIDVPEAASNVGPRPVPYLVGGLLTIAALAVVINVLRGGQAQPDEAELVDPNLPVNVRRVGSFVATIVGYALILEPLGYLLTTALAFFAVSVTLGSRHFVRLAVGSLVLSVVIYLAFTRLLGIYLPPGIFEGIL
ncbi:tripartite tricarboxylate transporter TctB family protein [Nocardioides sp. WG-D5]